MTENDIQKVLVCTNHLYQWAGSEVVTLEFCEELSRRGKAVTVLCNEFSDAVRPAFAAVAETLVENPEAVNVFDYDLIYAQHHILTLALSTSLAGGKMKGGRFPVVFFNHLSPYHPFEAPGPFLEEAIADVIMANSPETAQGLARFGKRFEGAYIFANPAPASFENADRKAGKELRRLAVISNHLPSELTEALRLVEATGVDITRIGRGHKVTRVDAELIAEHDAIVTIGKTVQYALRSRRPVFCYDHFAGPGWLERDGFERAAWFNFSGRDHDQTRVAEALRDEILSGYASARRFSETLSDDDLRAFRLEETVDDLLGKAKALIADLGRTQRLQAMMTETEFGSQLEREFQLATLLRQEYLLRRGKENALAALQQRSFARRFLKRIW